jgi:hypothetical protein
MKRTEKGFPCRLLLRERRNTPLPLPSVLPHKLLKKMEELIAKKRTIVRQLMNGGCNSFRSNTAFPGVIALAEPDGGKLHPYW